MYTKNKIIIINQNNIIKNIIENNDKSLKMLNKIKKL